MTRAALLLALAAAPAFGQASEVGGTLAGDTTWKGVVRLLEDVVVPAGATLTIEPGTTVVPSQSVRGSGPGWNRSSLEIHVAGRIVARGRAEEPIRLGATEGATPEKRKALWLGIILLPERQELSEFHWCIFENAEAGLQVVQRRVRAQSCVFRGCRVGVATLLRADPLTLGVPVPDESVPVLESCLFQDCAVGVSAEANARPDVERSVFLDCDRAIASPSFGARVYPLRGVGPRVERCEFLRCGSAVSGSSRVTNCIFEGNVVALEPSEGHDIYIHVIDRYLRAHNLYWNNGTLARGDVPVGDGAVREQPKRLGVLPDADTDAARALTPSTLRAVLALAEGSPGRGAAEDGGDVGAFGERGAFTGARVRPKVPGLLLESWLMCGPPGAEGARDPAWARRRPRAGEARDGVLWVFVPDAMEPPRAPGRPLLAAKGARTLVAYVSSEVEQAASLGLSLEGDAAISWNGTELAPARGCRFASEVSRDVVLKKGVNTLTLLVEPAKHGFLRARISTAEGGTLPGVACVRPESKDRSLRVSFARLVKGDSEDEFRIEVRFSGPVHWEDALRPQTYLLSDEDGQEFPLPVYRILYEPEKRTVILVGFNGRKGTYSFRIGTVRDEFGTQRSFGEWSTKIVFR